jgi:hypothetical protein
MGSYDQSNYTVRREHPIASTAGASGVSAKFAQFQAFKLKAVHAIVLVAGTTAGNTLVIKHGTTSIGQFAMTTNTAGVTTSVTGLNREIGSLEQLTITNGTDATGQSLIIYEYEMSPGGSKSA